MGQHFTLGAAQIMGQHLAAPAVLLSPPYVSTMH